MQPCGDCTIYHQDICFLYILKSCGESKCNPHGLMHTTCPYTPALAGDSHSRSLQSFAFIPILEESTRKFEPKKESVRVPRLSSLWALGRVIGDHPKAAQRLFLCVHKVLDFPIELLWHIVTATICSNSSSSTLILVSLEPIGKWENGMESVATLHHSWTSIASLRTIGVRCNL